MPLVIVMIALTLLLCGAMLAAIAAVAGTGAALWTVIVLGIVAVVVCVAAVYAGDDN